MGEGNSAVRDRMAGILILVIGAAAILAGRRYRIGTLGHMGPGLYPVLLGVVMVLLGAGVFLTASPGDATASEHSLHWRGPLLIVIGLSAFAVVGRYGGLVPATFILVVMTALADRRHSVKTALALAVAMVAVAVVIFSWVLQLQFPAFAWG